MNLLFSGLCFYDVILPKVEITYWAPLKSSWILLAFEFKHIPTTRDKVFNQQNTKYILLFVPLHTTNFKCILVFVKWIKF